MGVTTAGSVERSDRTGPTGSASRDWKMAMKRTMPPSTFSSITASAASRPD